MFDEPINGLDPVQKRETLAALKDLGQTHTIMLSTHLLTEVEAICQRVIILNRGHLQIAKKLSELETDAVIVGVGNGLILGWLMYTSGLVPPRLALFGLVGGPLIIISGALVILDVIAAGGAVQIVMTIPEVIWELGIGIYLIVKGYRTSSPALAGTQEAVV